MRPDEIAFAIAFLTAMQGKAWMLDESWQGDVFALAMPHDSAPHQPGSRLGPVRPLSLAGGGAAAGKPFLQVGGVAVLDIAGVLDTNDEDVTYKAGDCKGERFGTSYASIIRGAAAVVEDKSVGAVVINARSPGGNAMSVEPASQAVLAIRRAGKYVATLTNDLNASASLYVSGQADVLYTTPGGWTGSIGTIAMYLNLAGLLDRYGVRVEAVKSISHKDAGSPFRPMSDADRAIIQRDVNEYDAQFRAALARGRGVDAATVARWAADRGYVGQRAVDAGLAAGVRMSLADVVAEVQPLAAKVIGRNGGGGRVTAAVNGVQDGPAAPVGGAPVRSDDMRLLGALGVAAVLGLTLDPDAPGAGGGGGGGGAPAAPTAAPAAPAAAPAAPVLSGPLPFSLADFQTLEAKRTADIRLRAAAFPGNEAVQKIAADAQADPKVSADQFSALVVAEMVKQRPALNNPSAPDNGGGGGGGGTQVHVGADRRTEGLRAYLTHRICGGTIASCLDQVGSVVTGEAQRAGRALRAMGFADAAAYERAQATLEGSGMLSHRLESVLYRAIALRNGMSEDQARQRYANPAAFMAAAHTTSDFPLLLADVGNKNMAAKFALQEMVWRQICAKGTANDYKNIKLYSLSEMGAMQKIPEGQNHKMVTLSERREQAAVEAYGLAFGFSYQMVRNDDLGAFQNWGEGVQVSAAYVPEQLFHDALAANTDVGPTMSDGKALYHADHNNITTSAALSADALKLDVLAFLSLRDFGPAQRPINVQPRILLVPVAQKFTAEDLLTQEYTPGTAGGQNQRNTLRGTMKPVASPYRTGNRRHLFADPGQRPTFTMFFLDGKENAEIVAAPSANPLNMDFTATVFGCGIGANQYESTVTNAGG